MGEFPDAKKIIETYDGPKIRIMEVCGTHTHEIFRLGIRSILPKQVTLISGPGCPVCVTPVSYIDQAVMLALQHSAIICTFGDLIRVPGSEFSLSMARGKGAQIHTVYSPLDAVEVARQNKDKQVVFLAVGFETTTPSACMAVKQAKKENLTNFSMLVANKTMPKAYEVLQGSADAFLYPGHVNAITGCTLCRKLAQEKGISGVVTGFTAKELLTALAVILVNFPKNKPFFENCYFRVVREDGNKTAFVMMNEVMEACDTEWRGLGMIQGSGLKLKKEYEEFDAVKKFHLPEITSENKTGCRCGDVLQGKITPRGCPLFGEDCTPQHPVGACMVSNEGACSAYYQYQI